MSKTANLIFRFTLGGTIVAICGIVPPTVGGFLSVLPIMSGMVFILGIAYHSHQENTKQAYWSMIGSIPTFFFYGMLWLLFSLMV